MYGKKKGVFCRRVFFGTFYASYIIDILPGEVYLIKIDNSLLYPYNIALSWCVI